jgi:hypothetical protein
MEPALYHTFIFTYLYIIFHVLARCYTSNAQETEQQSQETPPVLHLPDDSVMHVLADIASDSPKLRYTGIGLHPRVIEVIMSESGNVPFLEL